MNQLKGPNDRGIARIVPGLFFPAVLVLATILYLPHAALGNGDSIRQTDGAGADGIVMDGALAFGTRLLDIEGETYGLKPVVLVGGRLIPRLPLSRDIVLAMEVSFSYAFRSDYEGFYYYEPCYSIGITPQIGFLFPGRGFSYALYLGAGIFHSFYEKSRSLYPALSIRAGIEPESWIVDGIYLSYEKGFPGDYTAFDTLCFLLSIRLLERSHGEGRGE